MQRRELSFKELVEGAVAAGDNATRLARDARFMAGRNRPSTALALGIASLEEWGKAFQLIVCANLMSQGSTINWNEFWNSFYAHRPKQFLASVLDMILFGKESVRLLMRTIVLGDLEELRRTALYVDLSKSGWRHPREVPRKWTWEVIDACASIAESMTVSMRKGGALRVTKQVFGPPRKEDVPILQEMQRNFSEAANEAGRRLMHVQKALLGPPPRGG